MHRLGEWCDLVGLDAFSFVNCIPIAGSEPRMDAVDWDLLRGCLDSNQPVVALGGFPSRVLHKMGVRHSRIPHPSPRNRQVNDRARVLELVATTLGDVVRSHSKIRE